MSKPRNSKNMTKQFTPKKGHNVVGLDTLDGPYGQYYLVDNYPSRNEAMRKAAELRKKHKEDDFFVLSEPGMEESTELTDDLSRLLSEE